MRTQVAIPRSSLQKDHGTHCYHSASDPSYQSSRLCRRSGCRNRRLRSGGNTRTSCGRRLSHSRRNYRRSRPTDTRCRASTLRPRRASSRTCNTAAPVRPTHQWPKSRTARRFALSNHAMRQTPSSVRRRRCSSRSDSTLHTPYLTNQPPNLIRMQITLNTTRQTTEPPRRRPGLERLLK